MDTRIQLVTGAVAMVLLVIVVDLVRRRRLLERYALLWMFSTAVLLGLAVWRGLLDQVADKLGVAYPPNALFVIALGFVLVLLLHFSVAVSRLSDQTRILAQRLSITEERLRRAEAAGAAQRAEGAGDHPGGREEPDPALEVAGRGRGA